MCLDLVLDSWQSFLFQICFKPVAITGRDGMSVLPTRREVGEASEKIVLVDFIRTNLVLSSFSFSLFCYQVFMPEMYVCMVKTGVV